jgi:hypothetical protein
MSQKELHLVRVSRDVALSQRESSTALSGPAVAEPLARLQHAAKGAGKIEPTDVLAVLAKIATAEVAATDRLGDQLAKFTEILFQSGNPSPTAILDYLERISALHLRQQAELKKTLELVYRLASPPVAPTVNVLAVGAAANRGTRGLGGKTSSRALSAKAFGGGLSGRKPARLLAGKVPVDLGGRHAIR